MYVCVYIYIKTCMDSIMDVYDLYIYNYIYTGGLAYRRSSCGASA